MTPIVKIETRSRVRENLCRDAAITPDLLEAGSVRAEMTANDDFGGPTKSSPSLPRKSHEGAREGEGQRGEGKEKESECVLSV
jgi:hypothetical protein